MAARAVPWRPAAVPAMLAALRPSAAAVVPVLPRRGFQTLGTPLLAKKREYVGYARNKRRNSPDNDKFIITSAAATSILLPDTLVKPPIWNYPRSPVRFVKMAWHCLRSSAVAWGSLAFFKIASKPSFLTRAKFQIRRGALVPTAKALHLQLNDALARGAKDDLRRICTAEYYGRVAGIIDARPRGHRATWDLVRYNRPLTYPRLADHKIGVMPLQDYGQRTIRQAVVGIASTQKVTRYDAATGKVAAEHVKDVVEYLVLTCDVNDKTYESTPWKIWGTLPETTLDEYLETRAAEQYLAQSKPPSL